MKKLGLLSLVFLILLSCNKDNLDNALEEQGCDNGTFVGVVDLSTEQEIIDFGAQCYSKIDGKLRIGITQNNDISDLTPLRGLTEVFSSGVTGETGKVFITFAQNLTNLTGLENLSKAAGIVILECHNLVNLNGLQGLTELTSPGEFNDLIISGNNGLTSLEGLNNLQRIGSQNSGIPTFLSIINNDALTSLNGLSNLNAVYGEIVIGDRPNQIEPNQNNSLSDFCDLQNLVNNGYHEDVFINNNAYNPTIQDIIDGNCSQ